MSRFVYFISIIMLISCSYSEFAVTDEYAFNSNGFPNGLSFALLAVKSIDSEGIPNNYRDSIRIDLFHFVGKSKKKIYFFRKNEGYYWQIFLTGKKSQTLPVQFEKNNWYLVWDGNFDTGLFKTEKHIFFIL